MSQEFKNYRLDGEPNPLYWGAYRQMYNRTKIDLNRGGMRITQRLADQHRFAVGVLSVNELEWTHFDFTKSDLHEDAFGLPTGKSAHIDFTRSIGLSPKEIDMNMVVNAITGRRAARANDYLYLAHVSGIENAGWSVYWVPRDQNPLHLLLINDKLFIDPNQKITKSDKERLVKAFWKVI